MVWAGIGDCGFFPHLTKPIRMKERRQVKCRSTNPAKTRPTFLLFFISTRGFRSRLLGGWELAPGREERWRTEGEKYQLE